MEKNGSAICKQLSQKQTKIRTYDELSCFNLSRENQIVAQF